MKYKSKGHAPIADIVECVRGLGQTAGPLVVVVVDADMVDAVRTAFMVLVHECDDWQAAAGLVVIEPAGMGATTAAHVVIAMDSKKVRRAALARMRLGANGVAISAWRQPREAATGMWSVYDAASSEMGGLRALVKQRISVGRLRSVFAMGCVDYDGLGDQEFILYAFRMITRGLERKIIETVEVEVIANATWNRAAERIEEEGASAWRRGDDAIAAAFRDLAEDIRRSCDMKDGVE